MELVLAAITLGFLGSFHCIGMCGPIALALPIKRSTFLSKPKGVFLYNYGRLVTYASLGFAFGWIGKGFSFFGWQQIISIIMGINILLFTLVFKISRVKLNSAIADFVSGLKKKMTGLLHKKNSLSLFILGLLNGLLPCGLVYMAIAGAIASGNPYKGALFMAVFGWGTFPAMAAISWFNYLIGTKFRDSIRMVFPYLTSLMAILLIIRGLNLGIPFLSPSIEKNETKKEQIINCHPN